MKTILCGKLRVVLYDESMRVLALPQDRAEVGATAGNCTTTCSAGKGQPAELDELCILLGPRCSPERDCIAWFQPVRAAHSIARDKLPLKVLITFEQDANGRDRHRILAEVYDLDAEAVEAAGFDPSLRLHSEPEPGAVNIAPEVPKPERHAEDSSRNSEPLHAGQPAEPRQGGQA